MTPRTPGNDDAGAQPPVWDAATLPRMVGHDAGMHARMLELFVRDAPGQIAAIEQAAGAGELALAAGAAHTLKTSTRMVGALRMGLLCEDIETAADSAEAAQCRSLVGGLADSYRRAQEHIRLQLPGDRPV